jgi:hypothetical protein
MYNDTAGRIAGLTARTNRRRVCGACRGCPAHGPVDVLPATGQCRNGNKEIKINKAHSHFVLSFKTDKLVKLIIKCPNK